MQLVGLFMLVLLDSQGPTSSRRYVRVQLT